MIGAVQEPAHASRRQRKQAAAPIGPPFIVPLLPAAKADVPGARSVAQAAPSPRPVAGAAAPSCPNLKGFIGRSAGSGQCVALAQAVQPGIGPTRGWRCGEQVQANTSLQPGTVI